MLILGHSMPAGQRCAIGLCSRNFDVSLVEASAVGVRPDGLRRPVCANDTTVAAGCPPARQQLSDARSMAMFT